MVPKPTLSRLSSSSRSIPKDPPAAAPHIELSPEELTPDAGGDSETGKFRQLLGILRKCLNVANLSEVRVSLPANLLEPIGNLESWQYCERPDFFAAMGESDDELERMMSVLRWMFTKDLKFVKHKIAKPYNSVLGEHFHAHWDVEPLSLTLSHGAPDPQEWLDTHPTPEVLSNAGRSYHHHPPTFIANPSSSSSLPTRDSLGVSSATSSSGTPSLETTATSAGIGEEDKTRTVFLNEQISHHPPISFFRLEARGPKGTVVATGADQIAARFTGTTIKVFPGENNKGIFVTLPDRGEEYQITHPTANVAGLLRGSPYATICEHSYITCRKSTGGTKRLRCIMAYQEESWLLKSKFLVEGVVYEYEEGTEDEYTKMKHVPVDKVVAVIEGCWRGEVRWKRVGDKVWTQLIDVVPLAVVPKTVAPLEQQHPFETRKVWNDVTQAILAKDWTTASKAKHTLEQSQRAKAEERKESDEPYKPAFFEPKAESSEWDGRPTLTDEGRTAIDKEFKANYHGEEVVQLGV